jgi:hypothetical protein
MNPLLAAGLIMGFLPLVIRLVGDLGLYLEGTKFGKKIAELDRRYLGLN